MGNKDSVPINTTHIIKKKVKSIINENKVKNNSNTSNNSNNSNNSNKSNNKNNNKNNNKELCYCK